MSKRKAIIIGAGPAGLTAAHELLEKTDIIPIIYEKSSDIGGISKTVKYKGNSIDLGGHRFFSIRLSFNPDKTKYSPSPISGKKYNHMIHGIW